MTDYSPTIAGIPMPRFIAALPVDPVRKMPVPWFVAWIDGKPEFWVADGEKFAIAVKERRCWVCGEKMNNRVSFIIGPMCVVNRTTAEPPCHPECAEYSVRSCPFLSRPGMDRREGGLPENTCVAGEAIRRNPGVSCLWTTKSPGGSIYRAGNGYLFEIFHPTAVSWWCEGREASRAEVMASVDSGFPILMQMAESEGHEAIAHLNQLKSEAESYWPKG